MGSLTVTFPYTESGIHRQSSAWYEHSIVLVDKSPGLSTINITVGGGYLKTTVSGDENVVNTLKTALNQL